MALGSDITCAAVPAASCELWKLSLVRRLSGWGRPDRPIRLPVLACGCPLSSSVVGVVLASNSAAAAGLGEALALAAMLPLAAAALSGATAAALAGGPMPAREL